MFCSIVKEGTTRWPKGLLGCSCFPEIPGQGVGCWSPEGWGSKFSFSWPWRSHLGKKAGLSFALFGAAKHPCGTTHRHPSPNKAASTLSCPKRNKRADFHLVKEPILLWQSPISVQCVSSQQREGMIPHWHAEFAQKCSFWLFSLAQPRCPQSSSSVTFNSSRWLTPLVVCTHQMFPGWCKPLPWWKLRTLPQPSLRGHFLCAKKEWH